MKAPRTDTSNYEPMEAGNHLARLYRIIYIGTVPVEWQGITKWQSKVRFTFEFPELKKVFKEENGEQPYSLSTEYTFSMHPKGKLRPMLESWLGKKLDDNEAFDLDIDDLIGKEALVNVGHEESKEGNVYAKILSISPLMKGQTCPSPINKPKILSYDEWDQEQFNELPDFLKNYMKSSKEYQAKFMTMPDGNDSEEIRLEDIPF